MVVTVLFKGVKQATFKAMVLLSVFLLSAGKIIAFVV